MMRLEDFKKLDIRIGKIVKVEEIPRSEKLLKLLVDFGSEQKQAVAGIKQQYKQAELLSKQFVFLVNLEPRVIMGIRSECMILAAEDEGTIALLQPAKEIKTGSKVV